MILNQTQIYEIVRRVFEKDDKDHDKVSGKVDSHKTKLAYFRLWE